MLNSLRLLIIATPKNASTLVASLGLIASNVSVVASADEVEASAAARWDAIIVSADPPSLPTIAVLALLRHAGANAPVIVFGGADEPLEAARLAKAGADCCIPACRIDCLAGSLLSAVATHHRYEGYGEAEREALFRLVGAVRRSLELKDVFKAAVDGVRAFMGVDRALLYHFDGEYNGTVAAESVAMGWTHSRGLEINDTCFKASKAEQYLDNRIAAFEDVREAGLSPCHLELLERFEVKASLVVPILMDGKVWGLFILHQCSSTRRWRAGEMDLLYQFGAQLTIALHQAQLYQAAKAQLKQLECLTRLLEDRVAQRTDELQNALTAKSTFLANASHELRTPMNGIIGLTDLLFQTQLTEEQRGFASTLMLCSQQMLALINHILDYSKVEAGRMELDPAPFNVKALVASVAAIVGESAQRKGLDFAIQVDPHLPLSLYGDSVRITQILSNLASNAVKFTASGRVHIRVESLPDAPSHIRFCVEDTGIGIAPRDIGKLFTAFTQADASFNRRFGGTGLGLAISKQLVELMGGAITVESIPGEGSTFSFALPLSASEEAQPISIPSENSTTIEQPALQHLDAKLLVVEDNPVNQMVLLRHLKQLGFSSVDLAHDGLQAVAAADSTDYDLILMDCQMPDMDGFEASRIIRSRNMDKHLPIIAITALSNLDEYESHLAIDMNGFLQKPYTRGQLETMLQQFLTKAIPLKSCK
ncbi:MAG: response regulator [Anaerolineae bacterium]|nr:response regulator [Gloeobacterales cyanobacterium ES-bin-313]